MARSASDRECVRLRTGSVAAGSTGMPAEPPPSGGRSGEAPEDRVAGAAIEGPAPPSREPQVSLRRGLSKEQAAVWIRVLLRVKPELSLARLAKELGFSDRQLGRGLGRLIREGKARIRKAPGDLRVIRGEASDEGSYRRLKDRGEAVWLVSRDTRTEADKG